MRCKETLLIAFSFWVVCAGAVANQYSNQTILEEKAINKTLAKGFPFEEAFQGVTAVFSDPKVEINTLDKVVKVKVSIISNEGPDTLKASGVLVGNLEYDDFNNVVQLTDTKLNKLVVIENALNSNTKVTKVLKQTIGYNLPDLTLFNMRDLQYGRQIDPPKEIEVSVKQLILHW